MLPMQIVTLIGLVCGLAGLCDRGLSLLVLKEGGLWYDPCKLRFRNYWLQSGLAHSSFWHLAGL